MSWSWKDASSISLSKLTVEYRSWLRLNTLALAIPVAAALLVHLFERQFPGPQLGQMLTILHFAPLLAVLMRLPAAALLLALITPLLNQLLTGLPAAAELPVVTLQLLLFTGIMIVLSRSGRHALMLLAPLVCLLSQYAVPLVLTALAVLPGLAGLAPAELPTLWGLSSDTWRGLMLMLMLAWFLDEWPARPQPTL